MSSRNVTEYDLRRVQSGHHVVSATVCARDVTAHVPSSASSEHSLAPNAIQDISSCQPSVSRDTPPHAFSAATSNSRDSAHNAQHFQCEMCSRKFKRRQELKRHLSNVHKIGELKTFQCDVCSKVYRQKHNLIDICHTFTK